MDAFFEIPGGSWVRVDAVDAVVRDGTGSSVVLRSGESVYVDDPPQRVIGLMVRAATYMQEDG